MTDFVTTSFGDQVAHDRRGSGAALVFIAGAGPYRETDPWTTATAEAAAQLGIQTIVFDRLGRGESVADGSLDLERELAAVSALITTAGGRAVLCGHSSGCSIALAAADRGLPVAGLALWEAPLYSEQNDISAWAAEFERRLDAGELEPALEYYMKDMPPEWLEYARTTPEFAHMIAQVVTYRADAQSMAWADAALKLDGFRGITVPTRVMLGESTFPTMPPAADLIVAAIPGAVQKRMPGADHTWEPEPMAAELAAFVTSAFEGANAKAVQ